MNVPFTFCNKQPLDSSLSETWAFFRRTQPEKLGVHSADTNSMNSHRHTHTHTRTHLYTNTHFYVNNAAQHKHCVIMCRVRLRGGCMRIK